MSMGLKRSAELFFRCIVISMSVLGACLSSDWRTCMCVCV